LQIEQFRNLGFLRFPIPQLLSSWVHEEKGGLSLATHLSAIKRARQNEKRRLRNLQIRSTVKSSVKKVRVAIEGKDVEGAKKALLTAIPLIQKARSKGVFHENASARKISRLTREVNALTVVPK
jgi:small subunit ribosomal protein S20